MSKLVMKNNINSELSITHADNKPAKSIIGTDIAVAVDTINDFPLDASDGDTVIVRDLDRGGTFIYDSSKVANDNQGTNFNGWIRQYSGAVSVKWFGATNNSADVYTTTKAFQNAFSLGKNIYIPSEDFYINDTLNVTSNMTITAYGSTINWTGVNTIPMFKIVAPAENISFCGGYFLGESSAWIQSIGVKFDPTSVADYARYIIEDVRVSGALILIDAQKAARFKMDRVQSYTANGIHNFGKIVEMKISNSVIFGSTNGTGTYGIRDEAYPGAAATSYPEGSHIANCTIDNFDNTIDLIDIFTFTITNSWIGGYNSANDFPINIRKGNTSHCREITINGCTIYGGILFESNPSGVMYNANIVDNTFLNCNSASIQLNNNAHFVKIDGNRFESPVGTGDLFAVFIEDNVGDIDVINNTVDNNYTKIFQAIGTTSGANINVCNNYSDIVNPVYSPRPINLRHTGIANRLEYVPLTGSPTSGIDFTGTLTSNFAKGEQVLLNIALNYTSSNSGILEVILPAGLISPNGAGWSAQFVYIDATTVSKILPISIPLYAANDILGGVISLKNYNVGSAVSAVYHAYMALTRI